MNKESLKIEISYAEGNAQGFKRQSRKWEEKDMKLAKKYNNLANCFQDVADYLSTKLEK